MDHILNQTGHYNRSERYNVVTTQNIINFMQSNGYTATKTDAAFVKNRDKDGYQRHLIRFCQSDRIQDALRPEVVIMNSYDGSQSIRIMLGVYRMVCSNGLIVGNSVFEYRVRHAGDTYRHLQTALDLVALSHSKVSVQMERMQAREHTLMDARILTETAAGILIPKDAIETDTSLLTQIRRYDDRSSDLFTMFNRIQENALLGCVRYSKLDKNSVPVWRKTKRVRSLDKRVKLNQSLWDQAVKLAA